MKSDFSEVIFMDESQVTFDTWAKDGFYPIQICLWIKESNKKTVVLWAGIVNQTNIEPFKVDKGV